MRAVVGLGNPGEEYAATRHNAGFLVVEELARRWGVEFGKPRRGSRVARGRFAATGVILVEPWTYMNCSADAVARLDADIRPDPENVVVVHDDIDLPCGRVALKKGGGSGGHRGVDSMIAWGGARLVRVRVGVGRPPAGGDAAGYVLRPFRPDERALIAQAVTVAADAVECVLTDGLQQAMNKFNSRLGSAAGRPQAPEERR